MIRFLRPLALLGAAALLPAIAGAQVRGEVVSLGRGSQSGAVCRAVRDYDDPVAQLPGGRAWVIRCQGVGCSHRASLPRQDRLGPGTLAQGAGRTRRVQAERAAGPGWPCQRGPLHLPAGRREAAPILRYQAHRGRFVLAGEGYAAANDVLETGLRVTSGAIPCTAERRATGVRGERRDRHRVRWLGWGPVQRAELGGQRRQPPARARLRPEQRVAFRSGGERFPAPSSPPHAQPTHRCASGRRRC